MGDNRSLNGVEELSDLMLARLAEKDSEKVIHWTEMSNTLLCRRLRDKERQLRRAIDDDLDFYEIAKRCADVGNFAMMILWNARRASAAAHTHGQGQVANCPDCERLGHSCKTHCLCTPCVRKKESAAAHDGGS